MRVRRVVSWVAASAGTALVVAAAVSFWTSRNDCDTVTAPPRRPMKAIVYCEYGSTDALRLADVETPVPGPDQVLIRVRAAAVNPLDDHFLHGTPYISRFMMGVWKPKSIRLGVDFAGTVEAVGANVTSLAVGDAVFGGRSGAFAQYVTTRADRVVRKPPGLSFEEAAALPIAGVTALQGLRDGGRLKPGDKVLINGASGGVGTFAVQIARSMGADVTAVCSGRNVALVRSLGADRAIDYTRDDFTRDASRYDVILDAVGNHSLGACRRVLQPGGRYVMIGGQPGRWVDPLPRALHAFVLSKFVGQDLRFLLARLEPRDLAALADLASAGKLRAVIDRRYPLAEVPAALAYLEQGHARGKILIVVE